MPQLPSDPLAQNIATRWRVVARFKGADVIGNPRDLLTGFMKVVANFAMEESEIAWVRAFHQKLAADPSFMVRYRNDDTTHEEREDYKKYSVLLLRLAARIKGSVGSFAIVGADRLFLSLLQQYELPAALRKNVEAAAKFYGKTRVKVPRGFEALEAYEKLLAVHRKHLAVAQEAIAKGVPHGSRQDAKQWRAGSFELVNTGGFDDAAMERVSRLVEAAEKALRAKKLGGVCYGKILISNKLMRPTVLAFYLPDKDEMFIRGDVKADDTTLATIIHELAHRMEETTHKSKVREIKTMHMTYDYQHSDTPVRVDSIPYPAPGMEWRENSRALWQVEKVVGEEVYLIHDENPSKAARMTVDAWYRVHGAPLQRRKFITNYAKRSPSENFAEMVSHYCLGKLPPDLTEDLEKILYH